MARMRGSNGRRARRRCGASTRAAAVCGALHGGARAAVAERRPRVARVPARVEAASRQRRRWSDRRAGAGHGRFPGGSVGRRRSFHRAGVGPERPGRGRTFLAAARKIPPGPCGTSQLGPGLQGTEPPMGTGDGVDPRSPANRRWRWGWTPDPRQIGDRGWGWTPDSRRVSSSCMHLMGSRMSRRPASVPLAAAVITRGRRARRRHSDIRLRFRMLMLSAGFKLMLQCQLTSLVLRSHEIASQTPIDSEVYSGDDGAAAHPKAA
jgi:hypothetical protein